MSNNFSRDLPSLFDNLFDFDRHSYFFSREEKDMHPYDITRTKDSLILTHKSHPSCHI